MPSVTTIRPLVRDEQRQLVNWASCEGWNPGLNDADLFWQIDPEGYLGIALDGELAGGGAIIRHNSHFGFMGLFIMLPKFRSRKLGTQLWYARRDRLLSRLDHGATIGLDAVDAMVPFYARGGFQSYARHCRFEWMVAEQDLEPAPEVRALTYADFQAVLALDADCFPGPRSEYLRIWAYQPNAYSLVTESGGNVTGFGVMRPCQVGWKIGPLFANSPADARKLLMAFGKIATGGLIYVDAPQNSPLAQQLCRSLNMKEVFGCVRMYLGPVPELAIDKIYSITNFEVG